jgi:hypothetical protein
MPNSIPGTPTSIAADVRADSTSTQPDNAPRVASPALIAATKDRPANTPVDVMGKPSQNQHNPNTNQAIRDSASHLKDDLNKAGTEIGHAGQSLGKVIGLAVKRSGELIAGDSRPSQPDSHGMKVDAHLEVKADADTDSNTRPDSNEAAAGDSKPGAIHSPSGDADSHARAVSHSNSHSPETACTVPAAVNGKLATDCSLTGATGRPVEMQTQVQGQQTKTTGASK